MILHRLKATLGRYRLGFSPTDIVLDIGSGNNPHPRADLLCDGFVLDDTERGDQLVADRPIVGGDLANLPFKDKSIDFAITSHVLEHVHDPAKALMELQRVAKRGYIETPAEFGGKLLDMPFHRWFVRQEAQTLIFTGKAKGMFDEHLCEVSYDLWHRHKDFRRLYWNHLDLFLVRHYWDETIAFQVIVPPEGLFEQGGFMQASPDDSVVVKPPSRSLGAKLKGGLARYYQSPLYGPRRTIDLAALCACPQCRGPLNFDEGPITCQGCGAAYKAWPVQGRHIPMLMTSASVPAAT